MNLCTCIAQLQPHRPIPGVCPGGSRAALSEGGSK